MRLSATSSQVLPQAKRRPLSTYIPRVHRCQFRTLWSSGDVYITKRTGDTGEPCGVPTLVAKGSDSKPLKRSWTVHSERKDLVHATSAGAKPRSSTICTSLALFTLSKKPWMLKRRTPAQRPEERADWPSCSRH